MTKKYITTVKDWWIVGYGIWYNGSRANYLVPKEGLLKVTEEGVYIWLLHIVEKHWARCVDIYALNTAFIIAAHEYGFDIDGKVFMNTITKQKDLIKLEFKA